MRQMQVDHHLESTGMGHPLGEPTPRSIQTHHPVTTPRRSETPMPSPRCPAMHLERLVVRRRGWRFTLTLVLAGVLVILAGCDRPESVQWGHRGTGLIHVDDLDRFKKATDDHGVPAPEPRDPPDPEIPLAKDVNQNVQVLTDLDALEFSRLMQAISVWVAPVQGCEYCHNTDDLASDEKYTKVVARRMLQMTREINTNWKSHVVGTGVTCWTCHRGQAVPSGIWFQNPGPKTPSAGITGVKAGQNTAGVQAIGNAALPFDPLTPFLEGDASVTVQGTTALPSDNRNSIKKTEWTYALMMYISTSLGVNCTYCHQTRAMGIWEQSTPQRVKAWHGIRMVRELNNAYLKPLKTVFPDHRLGPTGDAPKVGCQTCHKGVFKPLFGVSMLGDYPELAGYRERPAIMTSALEGAAAPLPEASTPADAAPPDAVDVPPAVETAVETESMSTISPSTEPPPAEVAEPAAAEAAPAVEPEPATPPATEPPAVEPAPLLQAEPVTEPAPLADAEPAEQAAPAGESEPSTHTAPTGMSPDVKTALGDMERRLTAAGARLDQERHALQQQLAVVRAQRDTAGADTAARIAELIARHEAELRAAGVRLGQERQALQQQLAVVRAQRDQAKSEIESRVAHSTATSEAALRAARARLDQERHALRQQLAVVRAQRDQAKAEIESRVARLTAAHEAASRAAAARLDQERHALSQQLAVVRSQRDAANALTESQLADVLSKQGAAEARFSQESAELRRQLEQIRADKDAAIAAAESRVAALTEEVATLQDKLAAADRSSAELRAQLQAATTPAVQETQVLASEPDASPTETEPTPAQGLSDEEIAAIGGQVTSEGILIRLGGEELQFPSGSAALPDRELPTLDRVASLLTERATLAARIEGHTDSSGRAALNQTLSRQRAEAVMQGLIERGVDANRLTSQGLGPDRPLADNGTADGRRQNRRVEIYVID